MKSRKFFGLGLSLVLSGCLLACGSSNEGPDLAGAEGQPAFAQTENSQTAAPNTRIKSKPANPSCFTTATFKFTCTAAPCAFKCNLDSAGWGKCRSGKSYLGLTDGDHLFKVKAGKNGFWDKTPASFAWAIQTTNCWAATSTANAPAARQNHTAVWTGSEMVVWGGDASSSAMNTGGRYDPATARWAATQTLNAPSVRSYHSAIWTGSKMIVWGLTSLMVF